jgi:hypothetical protein
MDLLAGELWQRAETLLKPIIASLVFSIMMIAKMITVLKAHKRAIVLSLIFAYTVFLLVYPDEFGRFYTLFFGAITPVLIAGQFFWIRRVGKLGKRLISSKRWRRGLGAAGLIVYFSLLAYSLFNGGETFKGTALTLRSTLLETPFQLWSLGSFLGFLVAMLLWASDRVARAVSWSFKKLIIPHPPELPSPGRRRFLEQTAIALSTAPFVAGAYGLFYGRLNLETTHQQIKLRRLPKAFDGFRIVQLSDLHISAFMSADEIRKYAAIASQQKADIVVLTGDYLTWDDTAQGTVVGRSQASKRRTEFLAASAITNCISERKIPLPASSRLKELASSAGLVPRSTRVATC